MRGFVAHVEIVGTLLRTATVWRGQLAFTASEGERLRAVARSCRPVASIPQIWSRNRAQVPPVLGSSSFSHFWVSPRPHFGLLVKGVDCPVKNRGKFWSTPLTKFPPIFRWAQTAPTRYRDSSHWCRLQISLHIGRQFHRIKYPIDWLTYSTRIPCSAEGRIVRNLMGAGRRMYLPMACVANSFLRSLVYCNEWQSCLPIMINCYFFAIFLPF